MAKYKIVFHWTDGTTTEDDNYGQYYDSFESADANGLQGLSDAKLGGQIFEMSNPGDYPYHEEDYADDDYEVVEVDESGNEIE